MEYRKGATNVAADALSRQAESMEIGALSVVTPEWLDQLQQSYLEELDLVLLLQQWNQGQLSSEKYKLQHGLLYYKG